MCEMTTLSPLVCSHLVVKLVRTGYQDRRLHGDTGLLISESHTSQCVHSDLRLVFKSLRDKMGLENCRLCVSTSC